MLHHAKFRVDRSNRFGEMTVFRFFRRRPSAILDLFYVCSDHPRSVLGGLYRCAKYG